MEWIEQSFINQEMHGMAKCVCVFSCRSVCFVFVLCVHTSVLYITQPSPIPQTRGLHFPPPSAITAS